MGVLKCRKGSIGKRIHQFTKFASTVDEMCPPRRRASFSREEARALVDNVRVGALSHKTMRRAFREGYDGDF